MLLQVQQVQQAVLQADQVIQMQMFQVQAVLVLVLLVLVQAVADRLGVDTNVI
tara:strand:- start:541 stop:699 length:159 start_codon:yes stop_codon:yes gene_type:complete